jgi:hypothetical protein
VLRAAVQRPPTRDERRIRVRLTGCRRIVVREEARVNVMSMSVTLAAARGAALLDS